MNRYETYKPSGIDWIGEVPEVWKIKRIKRIAEILRGASPRPIDDEKYFDDNGEFSWVRISDVTASETYLNETYEKLSELGSSLSVKIKPGDLFVSIAGSVGKPIISNIKACIHDGFVWLKSPKVDTKYLYYILNADGIYGGLGKLGTQLNLNTQILGSVIIPIPSKTEQLTIANYLDDQTQKIDRLIANKKTQAEKLKELRQIEINNAVTKGLNPNAEMKDSGIEWLGKIPKHWDVKHLKRAFKFFNNIRIPLSSEERADLENIYDYYGASGIIDKVDRYLFDGDFILIGEDGANLVYRSTPLAFKASGKFWVNNHAHILQPIKGDIDYNTFMLESLDYSIYISGSAQPKLTIEALSSMRVIVPPKDEQIEIANYLKERTTAIDQLIKNIEAQIEKLQELRKIKIYEAVTGKIKVNAYAETTA